MNTTTVILIAVAAVIVLAVLVFVARGKRNQRRHLQAEEMREDITTHLQKVDKRQAIADETAAKARRRGRGRSEGGRGCPAQGAGRVSP